MVKKGIWGLVCVVVMAGTVFAGEIQWHSYDTGITMAQKSKKKVFMHFWADWCRYCKVMEAQTFSDKKVADYINDHYIPIKVDGDHAPEVVRKHKVEGYPDNRFFDPQLNEVYRIPGAMAPEAFLFYLMYIDSDSYKTMTPMEYYKSGPF